jgi:hypothetical protein
MNRTIFRILYSRTKNNITEDQKKLVTKPSKSLFQAPIIASFENETLL